MASFEENKPNVIKCESCESNTTLEHVIACDRCNVSGCYECVKTECCDCSIEMCRKCSDVDDLMCDCFGKCYTCGTDVSRGSGWPCNECRIWNCSDCKKLDKNNCKECGPQKSEKVEEFFNCESCETDHPLEKVIRCEFCNINDESDDDDDDDVSVDSWDGKKKYLFCKECTLMCDAWEIRGCKECVEFVCCDCGYDMCIECRNNDNINCGCYGQCYSCGDDVNRGSEGWPCGECEKWYCNYCRRGDNPCKECGPEESEDEEASDEAEEDTKSVEEEK